MGSSEADRSAEFARRVLDHAPGAVIVVDAAGVVRYANQALADLVGHVRDDMLGQNVLEHIHPDDAGWAATAFAQVVTAPDAAQLTDRAPWAPIHLRLRAADGAALPVQITGHGGVDDEVLRGVIYSVRDARDQDLLGHVLRGIATGEPVEDLLRIVMAMVVVPPLDLDAAVLQPDDDGRFRVVASTSPVLTAAFDTDLHVPWSTLVSDPTFVAVDRLPDAVGGPLADAGYVDLWHLAVASVLGASTFRIVVVAPMHHVPATGVIDRLLRAGELAGVVLLRAQTDEMLAHAASHDSLTRLPNRVGFRERVERFRRDESGVVVLYVDLDGFKAINDRHGHQAGDRVLAVIADRLRSATRPGDLVARLGGDEFAVVLESDPSRDAFERGCATAQRIVELVGEAIELDGDVLVGVAASVGVAVAAPELAFEQILVDADAAMYEAKRAGGNRLVTVLPFGDA